MPAPRPRLFALLVGIDRYAYPVRPLAGCVNDIKRFQQYLQETQAADFDLKIQTLFDADAKKGAIVEKMEQHLGQAGPGDVALFYYSGHGAQEKADTNIWRFEPDGKLEGLVCYDSILPSSQRYNLLVDKELRYLINRIAHGTKDKPKADPPHVLTIFDCCHSGDNTRNVYVAEESSKVRERRFQPMPPKDPATPRMSTILPVRAWDDFVFAKAVNPADLRSKPLPEVMPEGRHVQLSACQSDESSFETGGSGVFSLNLVDVLRRSGGSVSYYDLKSRLKYFIKNQFNQNPQVYAGAGVSAELYRNFLGKSGSNKPLYGNVIYNPKLGWVLDMGSLHGVSKQAETVAIMPAGKNAPQLKATIQSIKPAETILAFDTATAAQLDQKELYRGYVEGFCSAPVRIFLNDQDGEESSARQLRDAINKKGKNFSLAKLEREADYTVHLANGRYCITRAGDPFRPLVYPEAGYTPQTLERTIADLNHISQWEYARNLHNDGNNRLPLDAVKVEFFQVKNGVETLLNAPADDVTAQYEAGNFDGRPYGGNIRIKVTNKSAFPVYVSLLYLSNTFEVYGGLLSGKVQMLEAASPQNPQGGSVYVFDGDNIGLTYEQAVEIFNWPESLSYFKLIASRQDFSVDLLEQGALADPALLVTRTRGGAERGITRQPANEDADAWMTRLFTLKLPNPKYNKVGKQEIQAWAKTEAAYYIKGLYPEK